MQTLISSSLRLSYNREITRVTHSAVHMFSVHKELQQLSNAQFGLKKQFVTKSLLFSRTVAVVVLVTAALVLLGWATDNEQLKTVLPQFASMKANTAICFFSLSLALLASLSKRGSVSGQSYCRSLSYFVVLVATLTLLESMLHKNLGIDELIFSDPQTLPPAAPGRMAIATAANFLLLGLALALTGHPGTSRIVGWLVSCSILNSGICILGYFFGAASLYKTLFFSSVALHTAFCFFILSFAILASQPERGLLRLLLSDSPGGLLLRRTFPVVLFAPTLIAWIVIRVHASEKLDTQTAVSLLVIAFVLLFTALVIRSAMILNSAALEMKEHEQTRLLLASVIESSDDAIITISRDASVLSWNAGATRTFGFTSEEILGHPISVIVPPDLRTELSGLYKKVLAGKRCSHYETRRIRKDGKTIDISLSLSPTYDLFGQIQGICGIARDITERKSRDRLLFAFVDAAPVAIIMSQSDGKIVLANKAAARMFGYSREQLLELSLLQLVPEDPTTSRSQSSTNPFAHLDAPSGSAAKDFCCIREDGTAIPVEIGQCPVETEDGEFFLTVFTDLTKRRQAEAEAKRHSEKINELVHIIDLAHILVRGIEGGIVLWSKGAEKLYGWTSAEALGKRSHSLLQTVFPKPLAEIKLELFKKGSWEGELIHTTKTGKALHVASHWVVHYGPDNEPSGILELNNDISAQKLLENQLLQSQKMEAIGRLAGGIAHDFNNLLTAILGYSQIAKERGGGDANLAFELTEIEKAGKRAAALTAQLLAFSRKQVLQPKVITLNTIVAEMGAMLERLIAENIELSVKLDPNLRLIKADPSQMTQVVLNLAINARDAMPEGGKLSIETKNYYLDESYALAHTEVTPGEHVMIAITDTGDGMDQETRAHIFEPFFTTKARGEGTGLGLSTVYGIIRQSGGHIWVYSELGQGTTFKLYFPCAEGQTEDARDSSASASSYRGIERVMVVEDEEAVRKLAVKVLRMYGYSVFEAQNAEEALKILAETRERVELVLTDVVMPGMGGKKLAEQLRFEYPKIRVLFMSGYTDNAIVHHGILDPGIPFLQKPFSPDCLAEAVRKLLDGKTKFS